LLLKRGGQLGDRHGPNAAELEKMDYLEFIAPVTSHIPDKGQVMIRNYGLHANAHREKVRKANRVPVALGLIDNPTSGEYLFLNENITTHSERKRAGLRKANIEIVFQSFNLIDEMAVFENV
jgi:Putative transposase